MNILTKEEFLNKKKFFIKEIKSGKIFIYPTDTIYGIGCNATNEQAVDKIRNIKSRESKPLSVIAPNKKWIKNNCVINENTKLWLKKLPGPYTLILELKNKKAVAKNVTSTNTLGVRIPKNWFSAIISKSNLPFITTSVNLSGQPHITSIPQLSQEIKNQVDYILEDGILNNPPSTIISLLDKEKEKIIR